MTLDDAIDYLTQLLAKHGDLPLAHEGFDEGPDEGCIVRLQPVVMRDVQRHTDINDKSRDRLCLELAHGGGLTSASALLADLNAVAERYGRALDIVLEADYGYIDQLADIEIVHSIDQLGPFFEEDIVDIPSSRFPCILVRPASAL